VDTKHGLTDIADELLETLAGGLLRVSSAGTILVANQRARGLLELGPEGSPRWSLAVAMEKALLGDGTPCPPERLPAGLCLATGKAAGPITLGIPGDGGDVRWAVWSASPVRDGGGQGTGALVAFEEITGQVQADRRLRESESRNRALVDAAFEGLCISVDGRIVDCNRALAELFGYEVEELIGTNAFDLATPAMRPMVMSRALSGSTEPYLAEGVRKDGKRIICELLGCNALYQGQRARVTAIRDVTERERVAAELRSKEEERRRLEERVRKIQKLESLGVLAGGIAHEFNNLLMGIMGYAELGTKQVAPDSTVRECLEMVLRSSRRASELTQQMLAYAGRARLQIGRISLSEMAARTVDHVRLTLPGQIHVRVELAEDLPPVEGDRAQLGRVVSSLITNACEAIGDQPGEILVSTRMAVLDRTALAPLIASEELTPGPYVCLEVRDTGSGMDDETKRKLFEPFFSTKFSGRGMGLPAVLGIVRGHGGAIAVSSEKGKGSRFAVYLAPVDPQAADAPAAPRRAAG
jgi:PAS domain S-box-containing protein